MKVITSIYLKLRPDLRDEWLTMTEVDDVQDALVNDVAREARMLNSLLVFRLKSRRLGSL